MKTQKIEFNSTRLQAIKHKKELLTSISQVIESGIFLKGKVNEKFAETLKKYYKIRYAVNVKSGHDALLLSLKSLKLPPQTQVLVQANAYPTAFPIVEAGLKPTLVDVDENGQVSITDLQKKISSKTKVLIIVHMYGLVGNLKDILKLARKHKLIVIEDCAQAFGSKYEKKLVGTYGHISCLSFYPTKNIGALGDGGAILTNNKKVYDHLLLAKHYGEKEHYKSLLVAGHSRLPEVQAAVLLVYLKHLKKDFIKRKKLFNYYIKLIHKHKLLPFIQPLISDKNSNAISHLFVIKTQKRDKLMDYLKQKKIPVAIHYPYAIHEVPAFEYLELKKGSLPVAERLARTIISLPFHSFMTYHQLEIIIKHIKEYYE